MKEKTSLIDTRLRHLLESDPLLKPHEKVLRRRMGKTLETEEKLTRGPRLLSEFAAAHEYFGLHLRGNEWIFREWAPNAESLCFIGDMTDWQEKKAFALERIREDGVWQISLPAERLQHGDLYRLRLRWPGGGGDRIPAYARRVVQDPDTLIFNAQVWSPPSPYPWACGFCEAPTAPLLIYEAHVGMAQEEERVGSYQEFRVKVLPRIVKAGYNTLQLMAVQEHPYYGSFGYQVSSFFASSSRFGTPEDLKELIDAAHAEGLCVIMDLIHSHAAANEVEGISRFDGTQHQYFHAGERGIHEAWGSRCFDYGKDPVLHFLLSNCRFWLDEYRLDGYRFDGVTSMLYDHHGLGKTFLSYSDYFGGSVDEDALVYLTLANKVIHEVRPGAVTIAEDVSGMPGLAIPVRKGGSGFDYRFAMGVPDYWIKLVKKVPDENWPLGHLWFELNNRRRDEQTISYAESHDQALVGDQTLIFRMIGSDMYDRMQIGDESLKVERGMALHKLIRLITIATAGSGYLNFMGNEFGHPEWIDFPRQENGWSYRHARRQWHLAEDRGLKYHFLLRFDRDMIQIVKRHRLIGFAEPRLLFEDSKDKVIAFERAGLILVFNFHPGRSHADYRFECPPGEYRMIFDSDEAVYGGLDRLRPDQHHFTIPDGSMDPMRHEISLYLPTRTALILQPV